MGRGVVVLICSVCFPSGDQIREMRIPNDVFCSTNNPDCSINMSGRQWQAYGAHPEKSGIYRMSNRLSGDSTLTTMSTRTTWRLADRRKLQDP